MPGSVICLCIYYITRLDSPATHLVQSNFNFGSKRGLQAALPVLLFSEFNQINFGYFDPENVFKITKKNNYRGEQTDILAKKRYWSLPVQCCKRLCVPNHQCFRSQTASTGEYALPTIVFSIFVFCHRSIHQFPQSVLSISSFGPFAN